MTGFGSGDANVEGVGITIELRAVNHRFLDVVFKLPTVLAPLEGDIRSVLKERLVRGRITCTAQLTSATAAGEVVLDEDRLEKGLALLQEAANHLARTTGRQQEVSLDNLLAVPELFRSEDVVLPEEAVRAALQAALSQAVDALVAMKQQEGQELAQELSRRLASLRRQRDEVAQLAPRSAEEALARLQERLGQLAGGNLDPQRLAQEAALLADKVSISEECERLGSHLEQFGQALSEQGQVAKRLTFLLQEMHREVNTMGAKTNLLAITQLVVAMKEEIESLREQVQNLE
jgi:uncharacterized protein (TIGR00255 family)